MCSLTLSLSAMLVLCGCSWLELLGRWAVRVSVAAPASLSSSSAAAAACVLLECTHTKSGGFPPYRTRQIRRCTEILSSEIFKNKNVNLSSFEAKSRFYGPRTWSPNNLLCYRPLSILILLWKILQSFISSNNVDGVSGSQCCICVTDESTAALDLSKTNILPLLSSSLGAGKASYCIFYSNTSVQNTVGSCLSGSDCLQFTITSSIQTVKAMKDFIFDWAAALEAAS